MKSKKRDSDELHPDDLINGTDGVNRRLSVLMICSFKHAHMG